MPTTVAKILKVAILISLFALLLFGLLTCGLVREADSALLAICSAILFILWVVWRLCDRETRLINRRNRLLYILPLFFVILVSLQSLRLPASVLSSVSPSTVKLFRAVGVESGSLTLSLNPAETRLYLLIIFSCLTIFIICSTIVRSSKQRRLLLWGFTLLGYGVGFYALLQFVSGNRLPTPVPAQFLHGRAAGMFINSNHMAGFLSLCLPPALALLYLSSSEQIHRGPIPSLLRRVTLFLSESTKRPLSLLIGTGIVVMALGIIFSISRMGIFSSCVAVLTFLLLMLGKQKRKRRVLIVLLLVAIVMLVSLWIGLSPVLKRYSLLFSEKIDRIELWEMSLPIVSDFPLFGVGVRGYQYALNFYRPATFNTGYAITETHNDYINLATETGLIGLIIAVAFLILFFRTLLRTANLRRSRRITIAACVSSTVALLSHSLTDFNLQIPLNAFALAAIMGLGVAAATAHISRHDRNEQKHNSQKWVLTGIAIVISLSVIVSGFSRYNDARLLDAAKEQLATKDHARALVMLDRCATQNSEVLFLKAKIADTCQHNLQKAIPLYKRALDSNPFPVKYHYRLALAYGRTDRIQNSLYHLDIAKRLAPYDADLCFKMGFYHFFTARRECNLYLMKIAFEEFRLSAIANASYLNRSISVVAQYMPEYFNLKKLVPDSPAAHFRFASYLVKRGAFEDAFTHYRRAEDLAIQTGGSIPGGYRFYLGLADVYLHRGELEEAKIHLLKAITASDDCSKTILQTYHHFRRADKLENAIGFYTELVGIYPDSYAVYLNRARAERSCNRHNEAEKDLLKSISIMETETAFYQLYLLYTHWGETGAAENYLQRLITISPIKSLYRCLLSNLYEREGEIPDAISQLKQAIRFEKNQKRKEKYQRKLQLLYKKL